MSKFKIFKLICLINIILIITSCSNKQYETFKIEFNKCYFEIANSAVDITNTEATLKGIQTIDNKNRIDKLKQLLQDVKEYVPKDKENEYKEFTRYYNELVLLRDSADWSQLSSDIRGKILNEILSIDIRKDEYNKLNSLK